MTDRRATAWGAYESIADTLRGRISRGDLAPASVLPSEAALCKEFDVVRNTVRRALSVLETEGLVTVLPGKGRVVRDHADTQDADGRPDAQCQYQRIASELRSQINDGALAPSDVLPSEAVIVDRYRVSRGTARQALAELENAGLVETRPGKGRFVSRRP